MKKLLAMVLALVMTLSLVTMANAAELSDLTDAEAVDSTYDVAVGLLVDAGIIAGYPDGSFRPQGNVTRAEMAKMICYALLGKTQAEQLPASTQVFTDVPVNFWAAKYIQYCYSQGIIGGHGDGTFAPNDNVTGYQAAKMLLVSKGYTKDGAYEGTGWEVAVATDAMKTIFLGSKTLSFDAAATREEAAFYIYNAYTSQSVQYYAGLDYYRENGAYVLGEKGTESVRDNYGRPGTKYVIKTQTGMANWFTPTYANLYDYTVMSTPVAKYITAENQCELVAAVTSAGSVDVLAGNWYVDGDKTEAPVSLSRYNTTAIVGGQGMLTEIYNEGTAKSPVWNVVQVNTFLAKVDDTSAAIYDANGHEYIPAYMDVIVYRNNVGAAANDLDLDNQAKKFEKNTYLLVQGYWSNYGDITSAGAASSFKLDVMNPVSAVAGKTGIYTWPVIEVAGSVEIDGAKKAIAEQFDLGNTGDFTKLGKTFNFFFDQYGNVIGATSNAPTDPTVYYGVISAIAWQPGYLDASYPIAKLMGFDALPVNSGNPVAIANPWVETAGDSIEGSIMVNPATVSKDYSKNDAYYLFQGEDTAFWSWTIQTNGRYEMTYVAADLFENAVITKGQPYIAVDGTDKLALDSKTQFLVVSGTDAAPVYSAVVGYENLTSMKDVDVYYVEGTEWDGETVQDYIVLDTREAIQVGATTTFLFLGHKELYRTADFVTYQAYIGTTPTTVTVKAHVGAPCTSGSECDDCLIKALGADEPALVKLQFNVAEQVLEVEDITSAKLLNSVKIADNGIVTSGADATAKIYAVGANTKYYKVTFVESISNSAANYRTVSAGSLKDLNDGTPVADAVYAFIASNGYDVTEVYYVNTVTLP